MILETELLTKYFDRYLDDYYNIQGTLSRGNTDGPKITNIMI